LGQGSADDPSGCFSGLGLKTRGQDRNPQETAQVLQDKAFGGRKMAVGEVLWLNAWQKQQWGILWIFECLKHGRRFALLGRSATRPGARARWRQGVIRLPPEHRECPHRIWREDEWELKVSDPLAYIAAPAGFGGVSRLHGAEVEAEAICRHKGFEARLRLLQTRIPGATIYRTAVVEFRFDSLAPRSRRDPAFEPHYGVPWEEAARRLRELVEENGLEEIRDSLSPTPSASTTSAATRAWRCASCARPSGTRPSSGCGIGAGSGYRRISLGRHGQLP